MTDDFPPGLKLLDPETGHAKVVLEIIRNWLIDAIAVEREACAKLAEVTPEAVGFTSDRLFYSLDAAREIAAAIRSRSEI